MEIIEQINKIKYLRLKPEERDIIDILNKVEKKYLDIYPFSIFFNLNDTILFEQDNKNNIFWVSCEHIWDKIGRKYNLIYSQIEKIIQHNAQNILNLKTCAPQNGMFKSKDTEWYNLFKK